VSELLFMTAALLQWQMAGSIAHLFATLQWVGKPVQPLAEAQEVSVIRRPQVHTSAAHSATRHGARFPCGRSRFPYHGLTMKARRVLGCLYVLSVLLLRCIKAVDTGSANRLQC
jgi:hypothetical protein